MKRVFGFILFWIAIGMTIQLFIDSVATSVFVIICLLIVGYNMFSCK